MPVLMPRNTVDVAVYLGDARFLPVNCVGVKLRGETGIGQDPALAGIKRM